VALGGFDFCASREVVVSIQRRRKMAKNHTISTGVALVLGLGLLLALLWALGGRPPVLRAQGPDSYSTYYVAPSCTSVPTPCYTTAQAAVDAADAPDDVIKVAAGTYTDLHVRNGLTQVVYLSKTVTIQGGYTTTDGFAEPPDPEANPTTLDARGQGRVMVIRGAGPTIEGFIITGGGGYYSGGGINAEYASPTIRHNRIVANSANGDGGAIFVNRGSAQILSNLIAENTGTWSGGLRLINDADVTVIGNEIMSNVAQIAGGGIDLECCGGTTPLIARNVIAHNIGGARGGGVIVDATHALLVNNILFGNQADDGAGIWLDGAASYPVSTTLIHNTLASGSVAGEAVWVGTHVEATLVNNIIANYTTGITNTAPISSIVSAGHTLFDNNGTDYGSGVSSANEVSGNPAFVYPGAGDYHIGPDSAAIDSGTDAGVTTDIDGDSRPIGPLPDLGADEARRRVFLPLLLGSSEPATDT
jgi:hypothetical protein